MPISAEDTGSLSGGKDCSDGGSESGKYSKAVSGLSSSVTSSQSSPAVDTAPAVERSLHALAGGSSRTAEDVEGTSCGN